jgi:hypothetical protein
MKKTNLLALTVLLLFSCQYSFGQSQEQKDRESFLNNAKILEQRPFDSNASGAREWGFKWLIETDQVSVVLCGETMELIPDKKNKFKSELMMQFTFGQAVYKLENPDKKNDEIAAQLAGAESMLRTYEKMLAENSKARNADLDSLVVKRNNGELKALIESRKCESKSSK